MRIIFFDIDCLRPDHLGCYGYNRPTSPTIDAMARQGTRFNHYYCGSAPCLPSRTAWASGRFGVNNGVTSNHGLGAQFRIDCGAYGGPKMHNQMFARWLREGGYDSICFSNFADRHYAMWYANGWSEFHTPNLKCGAETAREVNDVVLPWLRNNATREDYYLHINYWDTHRVYNMDPSWADRFKDYPVTQAWPDEEAIQTHQDYPGPFTSHRLFNDDVSSVPLSPGAINNRADFEHLVTGYDASIAYVDAHVQEVLEELERQGVLDDAVIIFSSDHGDAFGESGIYSDHVNSDECIHHIPLIIRWPGVTTPGTVLDGFMYNVDFAPTLCDILGMPIPEGWDGQSYKESLVQGRDVVDRDYLVWDTSLYTVQRAVRTKTHLYIRSLDTWEYTNRAEEELYEIEADPYQTRNVIEQQPDIHTQCCEIMESWLDEQRRKNGELVDPLRETLRERGKA